MATIQGYRRQTVEETRVEVDETYPEKEVGDPEYLIAEEGRPPGGFEEAGYPAREPGKSHLGEPWYPRKGQGHERDQSPETVAGYIL